MGLKVSNKGKGITPAQTTMEETMKISKTQQRVSWINDNLPAIKKSRTNDHRNCKGKCHNGATCHNQSAGGYGWWANALSQAGINPERRNYWSGSNPTPSTSINKGIAEYISKNAPAEIRW
jgi:hypothetical protein